MPTDNMSAPRRIAAYAIITWLSVVSLDLLSLTYLAVIDDQMRRAFWTHLWGSMTNVVIIGFSLGYGLIAVLVEDATHHHYGFVFHKNALAVLGVTALAAVLASLAMRDSDFVDFALLFNMLITLPAFVYSLVITPLARWTIETKGYNSRSVKTVLYLGFLPALVALVAGICSTAQCYI